MNTVRANKIDSLSTNDEVKTFLNAKLGDEGIIFLNECATLFRPERKQIYAFSDDTIGVVNAETGVIVPTVIPHDTNSYSNSEDTIFYPMNYPLNEAIKIMDQFPFRFYKADIDGNGFTDLVIDAGIVIIVMDMGNRIEGHMFSSQLQWDSYSFKKFLSLPDGTCALLLRHDHNPCRSVEHAHLPGTKSFVTRVLTGNATPTSVIQVDTLYQITTGVDSERQWIDSIHSYKNIAIRYADTVDVHLYNAIDTIIYKFHGFTNYYSTEKDNIAKIIYCYRRSEGTTSDETNCLEIDKSGQCTLNCRYDELFTGNIDSNTVKELWNYISCINVKSLNDQYVCEIDHSTGGAFVFYFDDGTFKMIDVWSQQPPMQLGYLSKTLSDIGKHISWLFTQEKIHIKLPDRHTSSEIDYSNQCNCY